MEICKVLPIQTEFVSVKMSVFICEDKSLYRYKVALI